MGNSVSKEAFVFLSAALSGAIIFFVYDLFRLMRKKGKAEGILLQIQDVIFWVIALSIMWVTVFITNRGTSRFYQLLGAGLGALVYGFSLSPIIFRILEKLTEVFSKIFCFFLKILLTPLAFMYNIMYRCASFVLRPMKKLIKGIFKRGCESFKRTAKLIRKK